MKKRMILLITTLTLGLTAGLLFCWSVSVTNGLAGLPDKEYITTFQQLNRAILNPLFFISYLAPVFLLPASTWIHFQKPLSAGFWYLLAASALYIVGVMGITMAGNVPMNDALDVFNTDHATAAEIAAKRLSFESRWNLLHHIRTICSIIAFILTILACLTLIPCYPSEKATPATRPC
jgi:uncharacterized membrane protein